MGEAKAADVKLDVAATTAVLAKELADAENEVKDAQRLYESARSRTTAAHNRLNEAQRKLDQHMANWRKSAPRESDWSRSG